MMYTRSYDEKLGIVIPESYGGTLLREDTGESHREAKDRGASEETASRSNGQSEEIHSDDRTESESVFSFLPNIPPKGFLGNIFKNKSFSLQNTFKQIGTEEILIIATAAFLFFSKDGDKECAIMLLLLLFLT